MSAAIDDERDELDDLMDQLDAEEIEEERLSRQEALYEQALKRGDRG
jgi:hypothetical protein